MVLTSKQNFGILLTLACTVAFICHIHFGSINLHYGEFWLYAHENKPVKIAKKLLTLSGSILLSMITDDNKAVRKEGYDIIFKSRSQPSAQIRQYNIPIINFNCNTFKDMIDWNKVPDPTEPPCIQFYSQQHLMDLYESDDIVEIPEYPCHSQNTERYVEIVSQSCLSVIDKNRPAHIASKIESRKRYTKLNSRKDLL